MKLSRKGFIGFKSILAVVVAAAFLIGVFAFYFLGSLTTKHSAVKLEKLPYYDTATQSVVLTNNTASLSGLQNCDIYISGPTKQIKYFETVNCNSLSSTEISRQDLLNLFNDQQGVYSVIIFSQQVNRGTNVSFQINSGG